MLKNINILGNIFIFIKKTPTYWFPLNGSAQSFSWLIKGVWNRLITFVHRSPSPPPSAQQFKNQKLLCLGGRLREMDFPSPDLEDKIRSIVPAVLWSWKHQEQAKWTCQGEAEGAYMSKLGE